MSAAVATGSTEVIRSKTLIALRLFMSGFIVSQDGIGLMNRTPTDGTSLVPSLTFPHITWALGWYMSESAAAPLTGGMIECGSPLTFSVLTTEPCQSNRLIVTSFAPRSHTYIVGSVGCLDSGW